MAISAQVGEKIGEYVLSTGFNAVGNCRWAIVQKDGKQYFLKEFLKPKYPPPYLKDEVRKSKLRRCRKFEQHHKRLLGALKATSIPGGNIVAPVDFFRFGLIYYHISPKIDVTLVTPGALATAPQGQKSILIKTVINSVGILHNAHIVHCDLKPENVLIHRTSTGNLVSKIIDLDGAFFEDDLPDPDDMQFDQRYMAPEVLLFNRAGGETKIKLTTAADIFSLGLILYEFWTGTRVQFDRHLHTDPASCLIDGGRLFWDRSLTPGPLAESIEEMLSRDSASRPSIVKVAQRLSTLGMAGSTNPSASPVSIRAESPAPSPSTASVRFSKNLNR